MSILVDTSILSELARPRPDPRVVDWAGGLLPLTICDEHVLPLRVELPRQSIAKRRIRWTLE
jgi:predicted nucleic acid-binding protein